MSADPPLLLRSGLPSRPVRDAFFVPRGLLGQIGGALMARGAAQQREIASLLKHPGARLCEIGSGPGLLAAFLAEQHPTLHQHLIDPSPVMRAQAARRCRPWLDTGRIDIVGGSAEAIPLPEASCDTVVAANNVAMWPDLSAGLKRDPPGTASRRPAPPDLALADRPLARPETPCPPGQRQRGLEQRPARHLHRVGTT